MLIVICLFFEEEQDRGVNNLWKIKKKIHLWS